MFARKIKSIFDKLIPRQAKFKKTVSSHKKHFFLDDKVLLQGLQKQHDILGSRHHQTKDWRTGVYCLGTKSTHKRHMNQLRKCRLNESEDSPQNTCEEPIDAIFDHYVVDKVLPPFLGEKRVVFLAILAVARIVIWTT